MRKMSDEVGQTSNVVARKEQRSREETTCPACMWRQYMWLQLRANFAGQYIKMSMSLVYLSMHNEGIEAFSKRIRCCSVDGRKRYENDKCGRKSF